MKLSDIQLQKIEEARVILDRFGLVLMNAECRTGKTRMGLSLCRGKTLFVSKKKALGSIVEDLGDFSGLDCRVINYEAIKGDILTIKWDTIVVDEIHNFGTDRKSVV